eukprot:1042266-Amphidinium_carterae.1
MCPLNELRVLSIPMIRAIMCSTPNSGKVIATIRTNAPELWEEVEELMKEIKESATVNNKSELTGATSSNTQKTMVNITIGDEEEMEISLKVTKKAKHG